MANIDDLPYQHGRPLSPIQDEGSGYTVLADYSSSLDSYSPNRQIFMAAGGNEVLHDPNETLYYISDNEVTANAPLDEDEAARESRRRKNRQREWRR